MARLKKSNLVIRCATKDDVEGIVSLSERVYGKQAYNTQMISVKIMDLTCIDYFGNMLIPCKDMFLAHVPGTFIQLANVNGIYILALNRKNAERKHNLYHSQKL